MNDPRTVREILEDQQAQVTRLRGEVEEVKAQLRLFACQLGWDPDALKFEAG